MGCNVGDAVGEENGRYAAVGGNVGDTVGKVDGKCVGPTVLGRIVGNTVGKEDGTFVGTIVLGSEKLLGVKATQQPNICAVDIRG